MFCLGIIILGKKWIPVDCAFWEEYTRPKKVLSLWFICKAYKLFAYRSSGYWLNMLQTRAKAMSLTPIFHEKMMSHRYTVP